MLLSTAESDCLADTSWPRLHAEFLSALPHVQSSQTLPSTDDAQAEESLWQFAALSTYQRLCDSPDPSLINSTKSLQSDVPVCSGLQDLSNALCLPCSQPRYPKTSTFHILDLPRIVHL